MLWTEKYRPRSVEDLSCTPQEVSAACMQGGFSASALWSSRVWKDHLRSGLSVLQLVVQLSQNLCGTDAQRCEFARVLSDCEARCVNGCVDA